MSLVEAEEVPDALRVGPILCAARVRGILAPSLVGILLRLAEPLARAGIPIVAVSTADTDYLFLACEARDAAERAWTAAGIAIR